jgi:cation diffusion facilitator CzcD-associated flavoprotein CzcO
LASAGGTHDVLVVGAGFSGLYQLHRLRQEGFDVRLVEAGTGLGGVWHSNRYPGARVDSHVPNYEFSIEAVWRDWLWSERFPGREELVRYFEHVDHVLRLSHGIDLATRVETARFDPRRDVWEIGAEDGGRYEARFLVMCTGFGSQPYLPELPGLDDFAGPCHHTGCWPERGVSLAGQRVGIIGTGASGVQVAQEAAKAAEHLVVFQRTPVTALPMQQRRLDPAEQAAAKAGYREMFVRRNAPPGSFSDIRFLDVSALEVPDDVRNDVFEDAWHKGGFHFWAGTFRDILLDEAANRTAYDFWRDKTRARIDDPAVAEVLAPSEPPYPFGTKRPSLEQDYYDCFNRPNVELIDLRATPIMTVTASGVRTTVREVELDVLVLATGFDANTGGLTAIDIRGVGDRQLAAEWSDGVDTHLGMAVAGFPNLLILYGPQASTAFCNGPTCAEVQGEWVVELLSYLRRRDITRIESTPEAGEAWTAHLALIAEATLFGRTDSWYMGANIPGKRRQLLNYPISDDYLDRLQRCAAAGYEGFVLG